MEAENINLLALATAAINTLILVVIALAGHLIRHAFASIDQHFEELEFRQLASEKVVSGLATKVEELQGESVKSSTRLDSLSKILEDYFDEVRDAMRLARKEHREDFKEYWRRDDEAHKAIGDKLDKIAARRNFKQEE